MKLSLIAAVAENDTIGLNGELPWHLPEDLRRFRALTSGHVVIAGRRTHESIVRTLGTPLPDRVTVVLTTHVRNEHSDSVRQVPSVGSALSVARAVEASLGGNEVFVIGGAMTYRELLPEVQSIYLTRVHAEIAGDARMPTGWLDDFRVVSQGDRIQEGAGGFHYTFMNFERK